VSQHQRPPSAKKRSVQAPRESAEARAPRRHDRPTGARLYIRPKSVDDLVDHTVGRVLDLFDLDTALPHRQREAES
jgi:hypothetical protein